MIHIAIAPETDSKLESLKTLTLIAQVHLNDFFFPFCPDPRFLKMDGRKGEEKKTTRIGERTAIIQKERNEGAGGGRARLSKCQSGPVDGPGVHYFRVQTLMTSANCNEYTVKRKS